MVAGLLAVLEVAVVEVELVVLETVGQQEVQLPYQVVYQHTVLLKEIH